MTNNIEELEKIKGTDLGNYFLNPDFLTGNKRGYLERALSSLKKNSQNSELNQELEMIKEWIFQCSPENMRVIKSGTNCELCGKNDNVYQYQIINYTTKRRLWVGSSCIMNFNIPSYDELGKRLEGENLRKLFEKMVRSTKENQRVELLKDFSLQLSEDSKGKFKPYDSCLNDGFYSIKMIKYLSVVYYDIHKEFIPVEYLQLMKVNMRLKKNKDELHKFSSFHWSQFVPILSGNFFIEKYGFTEEVRKDTRTRIKRYSPELMGEFMSKAYTGSTKAMRKKLNK